MQSNQVVHIDQINLKKKRKEIKGRKKGRKKSFIIHK